MRLIYIITSIGQSDENRIMRMVKEIKNHIKIERKVGLYEHLDILLTSAADANYFLKFEVKFYCVTAPLEKFLAID